MPGVNYAQPEPRYSASNWYTDTDAALMGIQSTAQFIEKYHHIIGKELSEVSAKVARAGSGAKEPSVLLKSAGMIYFVPSRETLMRRP